MIIFDELKSINEIKQKELSYIEQYTSLLKKRKDNLMNFLNNINNSIQDTEDLEQLNNLVSLLKDIRTCIDNIRMCMSKLKDLKNMLDNYFENNDISSTCDKLFNECSTEIYNISVKYEDFIAHYLENPNIDSLPIEEIKNDKLPKEEKESTDNNTVDSSIQNTNDSFHVIPETNLSILTNTIEDLSNVEKNYGTVDRNEIVENSEQVENSEKAEDIENSEKEKNLEKAKDIENSEKTEDIEKSEKTEDIEKSENSQSYIIFDNSESQNSDISPSITDNNVLLISEKQNKVFLPYTVSDLEKKLKMKSKYKSIQEIIDNEYIVPYDKYKSPIISRFREGYNLMKNKENASLFDCLSLAIELCFNSLLNPAIITACRNLNELDIYLDYLDSNELDKFNIFEVKYEFLPQKA